MSRVKSYHWRGTVTQLLGNNNLLVAPDGDSLGITNSGIIVHSQYASPAVNDRVSVLALGRQHYAQGKIV
jgi:hypothetical protein